MTVFADTAEGGALATIAPNVVVKVPLTEAGRTACRAFDDPAIQVNVALCLSPVQAIAAAKSGAAFVGRLDDFNLDGMQLIRDWDRRRWPGRMRAEPQPRGPPVPYGPAGTGRHRFSHHCHRQLYQDGVARGRRRDRGVAAEHAATHCTAPCGRRNPLLADIRCDVGRNPVNRLHTRSEATIGAIVCRSVHRVFCRTKGGPTHCAWGMLRYGPLGLRPPLPGGFALRGVYPFGIDDPAHMYAGAQGTTGDMRCGHCARPWLGFSFF